MKLSLNPAKKTLVACLWFRWIQRSVVQRTKIFFKVCRGTRWVFLSSSHMQDLRLLHSSSQFDARNYIRHGVPEGSKFKICAKLILIILSSQKGGIIHKWRQNLKFWTICFGNLPKNTTKFSGAFGGQMVAKQGGE